MVTVMQQFKQFQLELSANQRLRWGVFLILVIAIVYIVLVLDDERTALMSSYNQLARERTELTSLEPENIWNERVLSEQGALEQSSKVVWRALSEAQARAGLQSHLSALADNTGIKNFKLRVGSFQLHPTIDKVSTVRFEIEGAYLDDKMLDFINALESNMPVYKIDRLSLITARQQNQLSMTVSVLFMAVEGKNP